MQCARMNRIEDRLEHAEAETLTGIGVRQIVIERQRPLPFATVDAVPTNRPASV